MNGIINLLNFLVIKSQNPLYSLKNNPERQKYKVILIHNPDYLIRNNTQFYFYLVFVPSLYGWYYISMGRKLDNSLFAIVVMKYLLIGI